jgi:hypothetical protein
MDPLIQALIVAAVPLMSAVTGILVHRGNKEKFDNDQRANLIALLMGLAQNRIVCQGMEYIDRGWVTVDEYQDLVKYLWGPYSTLGGNGTAERVMRAVERLPFRRGTTDPLLEEIKELPIRRTDLAADERDEAAVDHEYRGEDRRGSDQ